MSTEITIKENQGPDLPEDMKLREVNYLPMLKLLQSKSAEVERGECEPGNWYHTAYGTTVGNEIKIVPLAQNIDRKFFAKGKLLCQAKAPEWQGQINEDEDIRRAFFSSRSEVYCHSDCPWNLEQKKIRKEEISEGQTLWCKPGFSFVVLVYPLDEFLIPAVMSFRGVNIGAGFTLRKFFNGSGVSGAPYRYYYRMSRPIDTLLKNKTNVFISKLFPGGKVSDTEFLQISQLADKISKKQLVVEPTAESDVAIVEGDDVIVI